MEVWAKKFILFLEHPAYSLELIPCYFFLFLTMKIHLRGLPFEFERDLEG
jgi:hypothetical protein